MLFCLLRVIPPVATLVGLGLISASIMNQTRKLDERVKFLNHVSDQLDRRHEEFVRVIDRMDMKLIGINRKLEDEGLAYLKE